MAWFKHYCDSITVKNITMKLSLTFLILFFLQQEDIKSKPKEGKNAVRSVNFKIVLTAP